VALYTSKDNAITEPVTEALKTMQEMESFDRLTATHTRAWQRLWNRCDMRIEGNSYAQIVLRMHIFHLLQTASPNTMDLDVGIPARGWHGEAYRGHIFWDELYIFPFLNFTVPTITRSLLMYRFRRLPEARLNALFLGSFVLVLALRWK